MITWSHTVQTSPTLYSAHTVHDHLVTHCADITNPPVILLTYRVILVYQVLLPQHHPTHLALHTVWVVHLVLEGDVVLRYLLAALCTGPLAVLLLVTHPTASLPILLAELHRQEFLAVSTPEA